jgi:hypothetical protein
MATVHLRAHEKTTGLIRWNSPAKEVYGNVFRLIERLRAIVVIPQTKARGLDHLGAEDLSAIQMISGLFA